MHSHSVYGQAVFFTGAVRLSQLPPDRGQEVAFAGRSNVGKSSAINAITGRRSLARVSKSPGRTRQINFFSLDDSRRLVDLPGYGFARAPHSVQRKWATTVDGYLRERCCLRGVVLLLDVRHPPNELDRHLLEWCRAANLPTCILLTKADKLARGSAVKALNEMRQRLAFASGCVTVQLFSATQGAGVDEARARLGTWLGLGPAQKKAPASHSGGKGENRG